MASWSRWFVCHFPKLPTVSRLKALILTIFLISVGTIVFYLPLRNTVFHCMIRHAWRDVSTYDIIRMRYLSKPVPSKFSLACDANRTLSIAAPDEIRRQLASAGKLMTNLTDKQMEMMLSRGLGRYLPTLTLEQKTAVIRLYVTVANVLDDRGIPFFLTAGSLLGVVRHKGFIPWDDDLDLGIDVKYMEIALMALACVEGTELFEFSSFHWKIRYTDQEFPFIDLFMFAKDDTYLWALTYYITNTFIYLRDDVYPLTKARFEESLWVPVPRRKIHVVDRIYDFQQCKAYEGHVKVTRTRMREFPNGYSRISVPCTVLSEFYKMYLIL